MHIRYLSFSIHSALLLAASSSYSADAQNTEVDSVAFDTIVVTAVADSSPVTVVTDPKKPTQPAPASDGADALKAIPGFALIRSGGTNGEPIFRGMQGSRLNILTDGHAMPGACPYRMDTATSYIAPETFDKLTVIKGPQTVIWGPGNSAGTVLFDRMSPRLNASEMHIEANALAGSWGRDDETVDLTTGNEKGYLRATANHSQSNDYEDGDGNIVPSFWEKWNADAALGWTPDSDAQLEFKAGTGDGKSRYAGRSMDGSQFERKSTSLNFQKTNLGTSLDKLEVSIAYNDADHVMDNYTLREPDPNSMMPMPVASNVERSTLSGRIAATWLWSDQWQLISGIDAQHSDHQWRNGMGIDTYDQEPWYSDATFASTGLFGELTYKLNASSRLISGVRFDNENVKDERDLIWNGMMYVANPTQNNHRDQTLPSGFIRYEQDVMSATTVYAGLGYVERFPDYWELFSPDMGAMGSVNAFSSTQPEKTTQLDMGIQYKQENVYAWISGYIGTINDFILFHYNNGGMMGAMSQAVNVDARIHGGEMGAAYQFSPSWRIDSTLAYAWGENTTDNRALPQIPPLELRLGINYDNHTWSGGALWRIVDAQNRYALNDGNVIGKDLGATPGFAVFSLNAGYRFSPQMQLAAGIDNVFNRTYAEHLNLFGDAAFGYPSDNSVPVNERGRTLWVKLNTHF